MGKISGSDYHDTWALLIRQDCELRAGITEKYICIGLDNKCLEIDDQFFDGFPFVDVAQAFVLWNPNRN